MTQSGRHAPRRVSRKETRQRRVVPIAIVGALTIAVAVIIVVVVMNGSPTSKSAGATTWSAVSYTGGPRLAVDRVLIDRGPVAYNHEVNATYRLKNVGDTLLTLQTPTVETAEGC